MGFLPQFRAAVGSFLYQKITSLKYHIYQLLSKPYHCEEKLVIFFHALRHLLPSSRSILLLYKTCSHSLHFEKNLLVLHVISNFY